MKKIAIYNQKGGSAKTLTSFNLAGTFAGMERGTSNYIYPSPFTYRLRDQTKEEKEVISKKDRYRVLLIDTDAQCSLTNLILAYTDEFNYDTSVDTEYLSVCDVMDGEIDIKDAIVNAKMVIQENHLHGKDVGIDIIPSSRLVYDYKVKSFDCLETKLSKIEDEYDICIIDTSPFVNDVSRAVLTACDYVISPMLPDETYLQGYGQLWNTFNDVKANYNERIKFLGLFLSNFRNWNTHADLRELCENFGDAYIDCVIHSRSSISKSSKKCIPVTWCNFRDKVAQDYIALAKEILKRM